MFFYPDRFFMCRIILAQFPHSPMCAVETVTVHRMELFYAIITYLLRAYAVQRTLFAIVSWRFCVVLSQLVNPNEHSTIHSQYFAP